MSSKINLQTCEYACKSSIFQDNQLIYPYKYKNAPELYDPHIKNSGAFSLYFSLQIHIPATKDTDLHNPL